MTARVPHKLSGWLTFLHLVAFSITTSLQPLDMSNPDLCVQPGCCLQRAEQLRLDCSARAISELHEAVVPAVVESLSLRRNGISRLERESFLRAPALRQLDLSSNDIQSVARQWWCPDNASVPVLKSLSLAHNRLKVIADGVFEGLESLTHLDLGYNNIRTLSKGSFWHLGRLKELVLDHNPLVRVNGDHFAPLGELRSIQLNHLGQVSLLRDAFRFVNGVETLGLAGNGILSVPRLLLGLTSLKSLDLSWNPLKRLHPLCLHGMPVLRTLNLSHLSHLSHVDAHAFGNLHNLRKLYLSFNPKLSAIHPDAFYRHPWSGGGQVVRLQELHMRQTGLQSLSPRLLDWDELLVADLSENHWICDCRLSWMAAVAVTQRWENEPRCAGPHLLEGRAIRDLSPSEFSCEPEQQPSMELSSSILMLCGIIVSAVATFLGVLFYNRCTPLDSPDYSRMRESSV
ncbi:trophoblast glycoprotein-like [Haemaphysalis longicornis]